MKHSKITNRNIQKWCVALRSGKYNQTRGSLNDARGYCCLGVACKIFIPSKLQYKPVGYIYGISPNQQIHSPYWLKNINSDFNQKTGESLSNLNDIFSETNSSFNFNEIADLLELVYIHKAKFN